MEDRRRKVWKTSSLWLLSKSSGFVVCFVFFQEAELQITAILHFWKIQNLRATSPRFFYNHYSAKYLQLFFKKYIFLGVFWLIVTYVTIWTVVYFLKGWDYLQCLKRKRSISSFSIAAQSSISCMILTDVKVIVWKIYFSLWLPLFKAYS